MMLALNNAYINEIALSSLSDSDKQIQLIYLSIFSHSLYFWDNEQSGVSGRASINGRLKWWQWLVVGGADALAGFISNPILAAGVGGIVSGVVTDQFQ